MFLLVMFKYNVIIHLINILIFIAPITTYSPAAGEEKYGVDLTLNVTVTEDLSNPYSSVYQDVLNNATKTVSP